MNIATDKQESVIELLIKYGGLINHNYNEQNSLLLQNSSHHY